MIGQAGAPGGGRGANERCVLSTAIVAKKALDPNKVSSSLST